MKQTELPRRRLNLLLFGRFRSVVRQGRGHASDAAAGCVRVAHQPHSPIMCRPSSNPATRSGQVTDLKTRKEETQGWVACQ
eukprot:6164044-Amphidinium_carterae.1